MKNKRIWLLVLSVFLLLLIQKRTLFYSIEKKQENLNYVNSLIAKKHPWQELAPVVFSKQEGYWSLNIAEPKNRTIP